MSLRCNVLDIGNSREVEFVIGSDETEVADAIYANKTRALQRPGLRIVKCLWLGAKSFSHLSCIRKITTNATKQSCLDAKFVVFNS